MKLLSSLALAVVLSAAPPVIDELQPRGAQKGRPFKLTVVGQYLGEGAAVLSNLPATFTPLGAEQGRMAGRAATFLVEPTAEWEVGIYPVRVKAPNGVSNILLFSVGAFPESTEEESRPGALPHQNDSIEQAQTLQSTAVTLNGTLKGPERDFYRIQAKAGERRVIEIEARRCGSAIDPVIRVYDAAGKPVARSEDDPLLSLDARVDVTFPREGYYYIEVHDARFSNQAQNFYRLKTGSYAYPAEVFPLGGRRGEQVEVSLGASKARVDLRTAKGPQTFVNIADAKALPLPFAVGDNPEVVEPVAGALSLPVTVNGRLSKPGEIDRYELQTNPGDEFLFELQARELGTSKIAGLITLYDEAGKKLASAGDEPLPVDVAAVQASSRTLGDPYLQFKTPEGVRKLTVTVDDLARRGGTLYAYRLLASRTGSGFQVTITAPFVNIPAGGTALVTFNVARRGYTGPVQIKPLQLPPGVTASGGNIPAETADPLNRSANRRAILTLTAAPEAKLDFGEIAFLATGEDDGRKIERHATGIGYSIGVTGASTQGVVDRQRPLTGAWLGQQLPASLSDPSPATLALTLENTEKKEAGYAFRYRWRWTARNAMQKVPETLGVEVPNFQDLRITEMAVDPADPMSGTFLVTSTRNTLPALYNIAATGKLTGMAAQDIVSPVLTLTVPALAPEEKPANASSAAR